MRIFYVTNLANKHPYLFSIGKWLKKYGHEVECFEFYHFEANQKYSDPLIPRINQMNIDFVEQCMKFKPDMLLVFKGDTIFAESLKLIKRKIRPIMATWWVDDPFCYWDGACNIRPYEHTLKSLFLWDHFFIFETYSLKRLKRIGVKKAYYLPNATDSDYFYKIHKVNKEDKIYYGSDLSFIGTPCRQRGAMIKALRNYNNIKLWAVPGMPWKDEYFKKYQIKNDLKFNEIRKIHNYTKINLNNHFFVNTTGANLRTFDIPACGGFLLTDRMSDITDNLYKEGQEVIVYDSLDDLRKKVDYYLKNEKERKEIAENARQTTLKKHLYEHRVKELLEVVR